MLQPMQIYPKFKRIPRHVGVIPDGNRRWAEEKGMPRENGYINGIEPGMELYRLCLALGIKEMTFYGFTKDNTKRPRGQQDAFKEACVKAVHNLSLCDASLRVVGDEKSPSFPRELQPYTQRRTFGRGLIKINFLVNYGWQWDLKQSFIKSGSPGRHTTIQKQIASSDVSKIDLIIRWGGRRRLSGFLPVQSIYSDFYIVDDYWPDFRPEHLFAALRWYENQDITLGG